MDRKTEVQLSNPPSDVISAVKFGPNSSQFLIASSWDCSVRLYDVVNNSMRQKYMQDAPILDVAFQVKFSSIYSPNFVGLEFKNIPQFRRMLSTLSVAEWTIS